MLLAVLGTVVALVGAAVAIRVGADDEVPLGRSDVRSEGLAIRSSPGLLGVFGPTLVVHVRSTAGTPVWVGVAHQSDLDSYLRDATTADVARLRWTGALHVVPHSGSVTAVRPPGQLDWWVQHASGEAVELRWPMGDGRFGLAVLRTDGRPKLSAELRASLELPGLFSTALLVAGGGVAGVLVGWALLRRRR